MAIRVRCVLDRLDQISDVTVRSRLERAIHVQDSLPGLAIGWVYDVVAVEARSGGMWLSIHAVHNSELPYPYPIEMFEVVDDSIPAGWCISLDKQAPGVLIKRIGFREWARNDTFYEKLVDRDAQA